MDRSAIKDDQDTTTVSEQASKGEPAGDQQSSIPHQPEGRASRPSTPEEESEVDGNPEDPMDTLDWDDIEYRYHAMVKERNKVEEELMNEFHQLTQVLCISTRSSNRWMANVSVLWRMGPSRRESRYWPELQEAENTDDLCAT
jgi:hypothetical protein